MGLSAQADAGPEVRRATAPRPCHHRLLVFVGGSAGMVCACCGSVWVRRRRKLKAGGTVSRMVRTHDSLHLELQLWAEILGRAELIADQGGA